MKWQITDSISENLNDSDLESSRLFVHMKFLEKIVCYYPDWSQLREPSIRFDISDINTEICTHLVYVYAGISRTGNVKILKPQIDIENHGYLRFTELGRKSSLPTLIAVGGWEEGSAKFSK